MIGQTISHFRITEKLGAGGMGEVYRAEDTTLGRHVAIKVLPDIFSGDLERLARFEREAKLLASLNHPNIATIHGLEQQDGKRFLVMELVEGETLAQRIAKGPLPVDETLEVCRQITEGLESAHEKGIVHRDLKPANVKITPEGKVKVLDFGLAKAFQGEMAAADASHSPTLTDQMTRPGVILGTAAYMSPEQAKGKAVDKRADIWAFGCVLYECLAGKRSFEGETVTETLASILKGEPDWSSLPVDTPQSIRRLLRRCLEKDLKERLRDIADVRLEMREQLAESAATTPRARPFSLGWALSVGTTVLVIGILIGLGVMKYSKPEATAPSEVRSTIKLEPGYWLDGIRVMGGLQFPSRAAMALSSDGRFLVYSAIKENPAPQDKPRLYLRRLDQLEPKPIAGTDGAISPFLSPDDRWIGFWADRKLMKVSVEGGIPSPLCEVNSPYGYSWGSDNQIYFPLDYNTGLSRVSADGGKVETLTKSDRLKQEFSHRLPCVLPAGKGVLFTILDDGMDLKPRLAVMDPATRKWRVLMENAADGSYLGTGNLVFLRQGMLMAAPFDLDRLEVTGPPVPAIAGITQALNAGTVGYNTTAGQFRISASGSLVYVPGGIVPDMQNSLVWVDHQGRAESITSFKAPFDRPSLSPDAKWIAYRSVGMERLFWIYNLDRGTATKLTSEGNAASIDWTPDSRRVVFSLRKSGEANNLYWQSIDGSSQMERLTTSKNNQWTGCLSPDGQLLLFMELHPENGNDINLLNLRDRKVTPFLNSRFNESNPRFSPDGRWIVFVSDESGRYEVYIQPFSGSGGKTQISTEGGNSPLWSRDGKQLFYRRPTQVWVVDVQAGTAFSAGKPRLLFEQAGYSGSNWDISPDGKRFLMVKSEEIKPQPATEMILVQNWFEELKRLVPTGKK